MLEVSWRDYATDEGRWKTGRAGRFVLILCSTWIMIYPRFFLVVTGLAQRIAEPLEAFVQTITGCSTS
jgi:hypothetical protein